MLFSEEKNIQYKKNTDRIETIDALRGLAALYIFVYHLALIPRPNLMVTTLLLPIILNGFTGVTLFFLLSGFTLCVTTRGQRWDSYTTSSFYIKRLFRIIPLYYLLLIVIAEYSWGWFGFLRNKIGLITYVTLSYNLFPPFQQGLVWASWFLGIQMIFYWLFPIMHRCVTSQKKALMFVVLSVFLGATYSYTIDKMHIIRFDKVELTYYSWVYQLQVFAIGLLVFFIYDSHMLSNIKKSRLLGTILLVVGLMGWILMVIFKEQLPMHKTLWLRSSIYGTIILGLLLRPIRFIANRIILFYGKISYSLYLNHPIMIYFFAPLYHSVYSLGYSNGIHFLICLTITIIPLTFVSYLTYRFIELPGIKLGKKIIALINKNYFLKENRGTHTAIAETCHHNSRVLRNSVN
jgi:peptidoglycan/LPS O-acetylase OafA/YrhL